MTKFFALFALLLAVTLAGNFSSAHATTLPDPAQDTALATAPAAEQLTLAGGCFWGMQSVFQHTKGVTKAVSGYAGGSADTASYTSVSTGKTGHAESVQITYDPSQITLGQLLKVYFAVAHDPTERDYQGNDHGTQYRSEIFYATPEQEKLATAYIAQLQQTKAFSDPIVTELAPLKGFYPAESYHQDYARLHPNNVYIVMTDRPKLAALEKQYPQLYVEPTE